MPSRASSSPWLWPPSAPEGSDVFSDTNTRPATATRYSRSFPTHLWHHHPPKHPGRPTCGRSFHLRGWLLATAPPIAEYYFGLGGTHEGCGSVIINQDYDHWRPRPILVASFTIPGLSPAHGGLPSIMELLAITGGMEILTILGLTGTIHSDYQRLDQKLLHPYVLRRNTRGPGYPLLRYCVTALQHHPIQLNWTRS